MIGPSGDVLGGPPHPGARHRVDPGVDAGDPPALLLELGEVLDLIGLAELDREIRR